MEVNKKNYNEDNIKNKSMDTEDENDINELVYININNLTKNENKQNEKENE